MQPVHAEEHNGFKLEVFQDTDPECPREWDHLGTMVCFHGRYSLGDKHEWEQDPQGFRKWLAGQRGAIILPLYLYDHSGITMNTTGFHCPWDSGQVGWIYVTQAAVLKEFGRKRVSRKLRTRVENMLRAEVAEYDQFIRGDVYGYVLSTPCKECEEPQEKDSCWGFYGFDYCLQEARRAAS
jgi:hypothetical protein